MNVLWILGAPGTGKSTLVQRMNASVDADQLGIGYKNQWIIPLTLVECAIAQGYTSFAGVCDNIRDVLSNLSRRHEVTLFVMDADARLVYDTRAKRGWEPPCSQTPASVYVDLGRSLGLVTYIVKHTTPKLIHAEGSAPSFLPRLAFPTPRYMKYGWTSQDTPHRDEIVAKYLTFLDCKALHLISLAKRSAGKGDSWNLVTDSTFRGLFVKAKKMYENKELEAERDYRKIEKAIRLSKSSDQEEVAHD
jgi:hypothetical protein